MKATSKTEKRRRKRGRPRIEGQLREPNGRISRAKDAPAKHAVLMRMKHYHLSYAQAMDPRSQSHIGRLVLRGFRNGLSDEQYDAALCFLKLRNDYRRSLLSPGAYYESMGLTMNDDNVTEYTAWVARVAKRYRAALKAIEEAQFDNGHENLYAALQYVIIDGLDLPHLLGAARMVLNALMRHFAQQHRKQPQSRAMRYHISLGDMRKTEPKTQIAS